MNIGVLAEAINCAVVYHGQDDMAKKKALRRAIDRLHFLLQGNNTYQNYRTPIIIITIATWHRYARFFLWSFLWGFYFRKNWQEKIGAAEGILATSLWRDMVHGKRA